MKNRGWRQKKYKNNVYKQKQTVENWTTVDEGFLNNNEETPQKQLSSLYYNFVLYFLMYSVMTVSCYEIKRPQENVTLTFIPFTKSFGLTDNILPLPFLR